jgi:hypothetical protein
VLTWYPSVGRCAAGIEEAGRDHRSGGNRLPVELMLQAGGGAGFVKGLDLAARMPCVLAHKGSDVAVSRSSSRAADAHWHEHCA